MKYIIEKKGFDGCTTTDFHCMSPPAEETLRLPRVNAIVLRSRNIPAMPFVIT